MNQHAILADGKIVSGPDRQEIQEGTYSSISEKAAIHNALFRNIMHSWYIDEIVQIQAAAAGVPDQYLTKRVEPMHSYAPFWQSALNTQLDFFNGQTESRYSICQKAAQLLMLEFFADEEGNIVVKIPNWVLGANFLQMNNCNIRYYDESRYTTIPAISHDDNGDLVVEAADETNDTGDEGSGGLGGFIDKIFGTIVDALGKLFGFSTKGEKDPDNIESPVSLAETSDILNDEDKYRTSVENGIKRKQEAKQKAKQKQGLFTNFFSKKFPSLFSNEVRYNSHEENENNEIDYTYANITDNVILDILDDNNDNVQQIDEYSIKVKVGNIHHNKYGSLYSLAKYYYGSIYKWHLIAEVNHIFEPTEIKENQWLILYFNEPISNYIINSSNNDINNEIQELKYLREKKLKKQALNDNEIIVNNFPFIKGEFISYPRALRSEDKFKNIKNIQHYINKKKFKKRFILHHTRLHDNFDLTKKIIYSNEDIFNDLTYKLGSSNNYILSNYNHTYIDDETIEVKLTVSNDLYTQIDAIKNGYILSDYKYKYNDDENRYEVVLTITNDSIKPVSEEYVLQNYKYGKNAQTGELEVILTVKYTQSTIKPIAPTKVTPEVVTPISAPTVGEKYKKPEYDELPTTKKPIVTKKRKIRLYDGNKKPLHNKYGRPVYYSSKDLLYKKKKLISYLLGDPVYKESGENIADIDGILTYDRYGNPIYPGTDTELEEIEGPEQTWKPPFIGDLDKVNKQKGDMASKRYYAEEGYKNQQAQLGEAVAEENTYINIPIKRTENGKFRSQRFDQDIPVIPNEYVISFTLTDSDQEVYNYIEVGGSLAMGILQGKRGDATSIYKCIPDKDHIMQFGFRQHPIVNCSPLVTAVEESAILGAFLLYRSQLNRYSGVLTCIEDSAIRVGNPIRMYLYDEHPYPFAQKFGKLQSETDTEPLGAYYFDPNIFKEQAVFYVESISRNIDVQNVSTMTLQLKNGRVMGMTNACDVLSLMYDTYYQEWQSRNYYYEQGGNNTATNNAQKLDKSNDIQAHQDAWKRGYSILKEKEKQQIILELPEKNKITDPNNKTEETEPT